MKKILSFGIAIVMAFSLLLPLCFAAEEWSDAYYRAADFTGELSESDLKNLDAMACELVSAFGIDVVAYAVNQEDLGSYSWKEAAEFYYDGFGYGKDADGILLLYQADTKKKEIFPHGKAAEFFTEEVNKDLCSKIVQNADEYGIYGIFNDFFSYVQQILQSHVEDGSLLPVGTVQSGDAVQVLGEKADGLLVTEHVGDEGHDELPDLEADPPMVILPVSGEDEKTLPAWYPEDPEHFSFFFDGAAPRLVDDADLFTQSEEEEIRSMITEVSSSLNKDIVIYTDSSDYDFPEEILAADFYDFNGYGFGENREGLCLFICMDPENRCWWTCCTGPETQDLYTEELANTLDDSLYAYLVDGAYGDGVLCWLDYLNRYLRPGAEEPEEIKNPFNWVGAGIFAGIAGAIVGGIGLSSAKKTMKSKEKAVTANLYMQPDSLRIASVGDRLINVTTSRTKVASSSGSRSGPSRPSGGSSFSGSYHGSSGSFHSGSGRKF